MKNHLTMCAAVLAIASMASCSQTDNKDMTNNPFLEEWTLPYGAIPFDKISIEHYMPAIEAGIEAENKEIDAIVNNPEAPTFANTVEALGQTGRLLNRVAGVFFNLVECNGTEEMLELSEKLQPILTEHSLHISLNEALFKRIKTVWDNQHDDQSLTVAQRRLLKDVYDGYVRSGATLEGEARERWREITSSLDSLSLAYGQNVQKATGSWSYTLSEEKGELEGLPEFVKQSLKDNDYKLTLLAPSYRPFITYSSRRDLREMAWRAYNTRCVGGEYDNIDNMRQIVLLRQERAQLLGYKTFADYRLESTMAKTPATVNGLLNQLLEAYKPAALNDVREVEAYAHKHGLAAGDTLQPWDFSYYSEMLKTEKYSINDATIKPYFPLEEVKKGVFGLAGKLYGVSFRKLDVPVYHPEVECFEVIDADSSFLGLLYTDFFPREVKRPGAWMTEFKGQWQEPDGTDSRPIIQIVMSFSKPIGTPGEEGYTPALLTYDECTTFLHEFGHSLHGLLTKCKYASQSGTSVAHDFVELPSQFNENFMRQKEFLDDFARNYKTGEAIPQELINNLQRANNFQAGYLCLRQLSFGMLDMAFHTIGDKTLSQNAAVAASQEHLVMNDDATKLPSTIEEFEVTAMAPTAILPHVEGSMMGSAFTHIFSGGYAAGYYGYKWAEVLDADAFAVFEREGLFNKETAKRFRHLLESGDAIAPDELFREFKGGDPDIKALMKRDGIIK